MPNYRRNRVPCGTWSRIQERCGLRVLIGTGRDAADVAISNAFGPTILTGFKVWIDKVV